jgi:hypothetical protein
MRDKTPAQLLSFRLHTYSLPKASLSLKTCIFEIDVLGRRFSMFLKILSLSLSLFVTLDLQDI